MWNACCQSEWYVTNMRLGHVVKLRRVLASLWYAAEYERVDENHARLCP